MILLCAVPRGSIQKLSKTQALGTAKEEKEALTQVYLMFAYFLIIFHLISGLQSLQADQ